MVSNNRDIKVWNISLGSNQEINDNFISAEAAVLDKIQYENDVVFVIAGTNKPNAMIEKIGSPADSINGLVVNAITKSGISTKYTRKGLALSFFAKPDVSYYGGSQEKYIKVCEPLGEANVAGTSFAAPWIARKLSYLIDILGLKRELAKALIIDSARGWNEKPTMDEISIYGHGVVPIRIEDIIYTPDDEIRFLVSDISEKWNTYNYDFPIPYISDNDIKKYPYITRATMCYFPTCNRSQGIDYTNTELDLHFGRVYEDSKNRIKIREIDDNKQNQEEDSAFISESYARSEYQKWNNIKYKSEKMKVRYKKYYPDRMWGMEIKTANRLDPKDGIGLRFAVVVTIKEVKGINRIDEFIKNFQLESWLVNRIDVKARIDINETINETIEFE
ncbi:S8 family peptidase [uncultured Streptococcus sp.]|uniref:S8 family peptidase n=1 Tax=uncultured Streptococcus sp. TaxID=83427 RepID=UPI00338F6BDD